MNEATYTGTCHCGAVRFRVITDLSAAGRCNCSYCKRRGSILHQVPADNFILDTGEDNLSTYGNRDFSKHFFCSTCGIHCFTRSHFEEHEFVVVNLGCLDDVDYDNLNPPLFDGARLL